MRVAYQDARCSSGTAICSLVDQCSRGTDGGGSTRPGIVSTVSTASLRIGSVVGPVGKNSLASGISAMSRR